jgi:multidrug efflux pump subunit AcrB
MSRLSFSSFSVMTTFGVLAIIGLVASERLNLQLVPTLRDSQFYISFWWSDASPRIIEREVTAHLEAVFSSIRGLQAISSISSKGGGVITLQFKKKLNRDKLRYEIASRIRQCYNNLPKGVTYPSISDVETTHWRPALLTIGMTTTGTSKELDYFIQKQVIPSLSLIQGVRETTVTTSEKNIVDITFSSEKVLALKMTGDEIAAEIKAFLKHLPVGRVKYEDVRGDTSEIQVDLNFNRTDSIDWNKIPIRNTEGRIIYLGDVATIVIRGQSPNAYFRVNGLKTMILSVQADESANSVHVSTAIKKLLNQKGWMPETCFATVLNDQSDFLEAQLEKIEWRVALSLFVLMTFLGISSRQKLVPIILVSCCSLSIAIIPIVLLGAQINSYSLMAVVVGIAFTICFCLSSLRYSYRNCFANGVFELTISSIPILIALSLVFLLNENRRVHFEDFSVLLMSIVIVTILTALVLIPAMQTRFANLSNPPAPNLARKRFITICNRGYQKFLVIAYKCRFALIFMIIMSFGIPIHLLPEKLLGSDRASNFYNHTIGNIKYAINEKPAVSKIFGGTFRLFSDRVFSNSYISPQGRTMLYLTARMPEGCTILQMNETIRAMENFLSKFDEIQLFQSTIASYKSASIKIQFLPRYEQSDFPLLLKGHLESKAIDLGGANWNVFGVGIPFSNSTFGGFKSNRIILEGYNYEELYRYSEQLRDEIARHPRVADVQVSTSDKSLEAPADEFYFSFNDQLLASHNISKQDFFRVLKERGTQGLVGHVSMAGELTPVYSHSDKFNAFDTWEMNNTTINTNTGAVNVGQAGTVIKRASGSDITKYDQQYRMVLLYDFIGPPALGKKIEERFINGFQGKLPLGFSVHSERNTLLRVGPSATVSWDKDEDGQYYILAIAVLLTYIASAVTFESLLQPLIVISMIPICFIGSFLAFVAANANFDEGGFIGSILLCGLAASGTILIVNTYNSYTPSNGNSVQRITKAVLHNFEVTTILTIFISLSLTPFIVLGQQEPFWYSFSVATVGGLIFSSVGLYIFAPLFLLMQK